MPVRKILFCKIEKPARQIVWTLHMNFVLPFLRNVHFGMESLYLNYYFLLFLLFILYPLYNLLCRNSTSTSADMICFYRNSHVQATYKAHEGKIIVSAAITDVEPVLLFFKILRTGKAC